MKKWYSASTRGFYVEGIGALPPSDAVEISEALYEAMFAGQANGKQIVPGPDGLPTLAEPPGFTRDELAGMRRAAYVAEADPLFFMVQRGEATQEEWLAKINEIKARFPYPV